MKIGNKIFYQKKVYNSIAWAKENIRTAPDGAVFFADVHKYTRGRQGRIWQYDKDQLLTTILLKPTILNQMKKSDLELRVNQLNMAMCLGVLEPLKDFGISIKWPNDFVYNGKNGFKKKVGGILFELVWQGNNLLGVVFGFALNVNNVISKDSDIYDIAISLKSILGASIDKRVLFQNLLKSLNRYYEKWLDAEFSEIFYRWKNEQIYLSQNIKIHKKDKSLIKGKLVSFVKNGDLVLESKSVKKTISFYMIEKIEL